MHSFICKYRIILAGNTPESLLCLPDMHKVFPEPHTLINESGSYTGRGCLSQKFVRATHTFKNGIP